MTDETEMDDTPETNDVDVTEIVMDMMGGANPKPDTAEGVGALMTSAVALVEGRMMADAGIVYDPELGSSINLIRTPDGCIDYSLQRELEDRAFVDAVKDSVDQVAAETSAQTFYGTPE